MATSKDYLNFILEQLSPLEEISYRPMMGEYIIYYREKVAAYICDDRLLVKIMPCTETLLPDASREKPYDGAKDMLLVDNVDEPSFLAGLFTSMYPHLPMPKPKSKKD